ncbi:DUF3761 domain-containing protein [Fluviicola taffensis]|uniref:Uncharacterized protein n=1 Tax=Fluviicola taffensis (strain DSM 16823 / NCIMB 13979 / RW262) TaxID=755732 RepID=F2IBL8_FLUTR|nr:DUF3761 domain-containing protein [Fluviicola taffensis]AEA45344.1 hypothetical protein Fluta_3372 [Fluviicola taffensis DSM 16823]
MKKNRFESNDTWFYVVACIILMSMLFSDLIKKIIVIDWIRYALLILLPTFLIILINKTQRKKNIGVNDKDGEQLVKRHFFSKKKILRCILLILVFLILIVALVKLCGVMLDCEYSVFLLLSLFLFGFLAIEIYLFTKAFSYISRRFQKDKKIFFSISKWRIWESSSFTQFLSITILVTIFSWIFSGQLFMNWVNDKFTNPDVLAKKYYHESITTYRVGAVCSDGTGSFATGSGACSHHGGVSYWVEDTIYNKSLERCKKEAKEFSWVD